LYSHVPRSAKECEGKNPHTPKWTPMWELKSRWTPRCLENDYKGQNPMDRRVLHNIGKLLKRGCLKWARMTHLDIWNTSYGQKKGWESNWFSTTKSWESPQYPCVQVACDIPLKRSQRGLQFCCRPHLNRRSAHKVMGPQNRESPNFGNFRTPTWESRDKKPFGCEPCGEA